jgi:hypothetical protein
MRTLFLAACLSAQLAPPFFRAEDVRPHGAAEPHPLSPGLLAWIFGANLTKSPGCCAQSLMDPATYKTELCGTRVLVGGIAARLIAVMPGQINFVLPDHPWENENVEVQVIRDGQASAAVPVYFGFNKPVLSLAAPAYAGMPVWIHVEKPYGTGWLRYPYYTEPWNIGPGRFEVRFHGRDLELLPQIPYPPPNLGMMLGLPREVPAKYLNRVPLHLVYPMDQPGSYQIRYTEHRDPPQTSSWTTIEILPHRKQTLAAPPPSDTVELLSNYLPSLLAARDEATLRLLTPYLNSKDSLVSHYAAYALNYFDPALLRRVVPGRLPQRGGVR